MLTTILGRQNAGKARSQLVRLGRAMILGLIGLAFIVNVFALIVVYGFAIAENQYIAAVVLTVIAAGYWYGIFWTIGQLQVRRARNEVSRS